MTPGVSWLPTFAFYKWKNAARPSQSELVLLLLLQQLEGQLGAGCSRMASVGATLLTSKVFSLPFSKRLGLVLTLVAGAQESEWMCTGPLEAKAQNWNHRTLLWPKQSQGQETDSRSSWKALESPVSNRVGRERGRNWDVFAGNPLHRATTLIEMEIEGGGCNSRLYFLSKHPAFM